jgi:uncharacterized protein (TIGR03083 family)
VTEVRVPQAEHVHVQLDPAATLCAYAAHRRRFAALAANFTTDELAAPSRCSEWSVADVLRHSCNVDEWMGAIWAGDAPPFTTFDPRTTPHEFVVAGRAVPDTEVRDRFVASCAVMATDIDGATSERWALPSLSPLGAVPWWMSALHVFWDSWVHERDVRVPLGIASPVEPEDATPMLAYTLALVGVFARDHVDEVVAGTRVVAGSGPVTVTPAGVPDETVAAVIDVLSGRDAVDDVPPTGPSVLSERLGGLARFLRTTP